MEKSLKFNPEETVPFPAVPHSTSSVEISNEWDKAVIFKMKSTRPGVLKMRPVFGMIAPKEKMTVKLTIKVVDPTEFRFSSNDRFTIVLAPAPKVKSNVATVFREKKCVEVRQQAIRKTLRFKVASDDKSSKTNVTDENKSSKRPATDPLSEKEYGYDDAMLRTPDDRELEEEKPKEQKNLKEVAKLKVVTNKKDESSSDSSNDDEEEQQKRKK